METTILTKKNCHRAATVREINNPDAPVLTFKFREHEVSRNFFGSQRAHIIGNDIIVNDDNTEMAKWEVVSWRYEENFEDLWNLAVRAFEGTSHTPEERARFYIHSYEDTLQNDLKQILGEERERYTEKFREWVRTLFERHSRILSPMITGPARFPTSRNNKANNAYDNALNEFENWRVKAIKAINRRMEEAKPEEQKRSEEWLRLRMEIISTANTLKDIDTGVNKYSMRSLFISSLYGKLERIANNGKADLIQKATEYIKELNGTLPKPIFTARHKFWRLSEVVQASIKRESEIRGRDDAELAFDGGKVVKNYAEDRLQILFDEKPDQETISKLKHNGFRWSPRFTAWQRQLTSNAFYACARVISVTVEQLRDAK
jgi:hypothetical protein|nr:MAG TPA: hypothetical protein [Caudoviricetes sp.]